ncbi:hypothetical protein [Paeniglutamicibacter kerguelensis]|nr:hypothetical protein [Paeniglutamicibacter kerguelensis]
MQTRQVVCSLVRLAAGGFWCEFGFMSLPPRPIQLATHDGVPCWLLTPVPLTDGHLGREVVGALLEGTLVGFERTDVHRGTLTLSGTGRIELLDSKHMLVACDPPAPVETIPAARLAREIPGCFIAWNDARTRTAWGGVLEKAP